MSPDVLFKIVFERSDGGESIYFILTDMEKPQNAVDIANKRFQKDYDSYETSSWRKVSVEIMDGLFIHPESTD